MTKKQKNNLLWSSDEISLSLRFLVSTSINPDESSEWHYNLWETTFWMWERCSLGMMWLINFINGNAIQVHSVYAYVFEWQNDSGAIRWQNYYMSISSLYYIYIVFSPKMCFHPKMNFRIFCRKCIFAFFPQKNLCIFRQIAFPHFFRQKCVSTFFYQKIVPYFFRQKRVSTSSPPKMYFHFFPQKVCFHIFSAKNMFPHFFRQKRVKIYFSSKTCFHIFRQKRVFTFSTKKCFRVFNSTLFHENAIPHFFIKRDSIFFFKNTNLCFSTENQDCAFSIVNEILRFFAENVILYFPAKNYIRVLSLKTWPAFVCQKHDTLSWFYEILRNCIFERKYNNIYW